LRIHRVLSGLRLRVGYPDGFGDLGDALTLGAQLLDPFDDLLLSGRQAAPVVVGEQCFRHRQSSWG
jgi:hypothetical protein